MYYYETAHVVLCQMLVTYVSGSPPTEVDSNAVPDTHCWHAEVRRLQLISIIVIMSIIIFTWSSGISSSSVAS